MEGHMSEKALKRPSLIFTFSCLLIFYGAFQFVEGAVNAHLSNSPPELRPFIIAQLISTIIRSGLQITAGIGVLNRLRWGWWLSGVVLCSSLLGSVIGFLQLLMIRIYGPFSYPGYSEILFLIITIFIISLCLLLFLYSKTMTEYLRTSDIKKLKSLSIFFAYAFLLFVLSYVLMLAGNLIMIRSIL